MKQVFLFSLVFALTACSPKPDKAIMTIKAYSNTHIGISEDLLIKTYGYPLNIVVNGDNTKQFEYVERFQMGNSQLSVIEVRRYFFYIKDGKVVSKRMTIRNQPAWELDSDSNNL